VPARPQDSGCDIEDRTVVPINSTSNDDLRAIAEGLALLNLSDDERLRVGFPVYDALHVYGVRHSPSGRPRC
jgi:hypothetical protein